MVKRKASEQLDIEPDASWETTAWKEDLSIAIGALVGYPEAKVVEEAICVS